MGTRPALIQKVLPIQRISLGGAESGVADNAAQFLFRGAVGHACSPHYIFFQHHRANVVAAEAQSHLANFQALCDPTGLHIHEIR